MFFKHTKFTVAIYLRLSREDGDKTESDSIANQRTLIQNYLSTQPSLQFVKEYVDDGYTGSNFERPGFITMMEDIKRQRINCIIVKDLSRFGRNYIEVGRYIEKKFPAMGIRFIAINDQFDNAKESGDAEQIIVPFKNLINDAYDSPEYVKDMGTPERYYSVCEDYKTGRVSGKNLKNKQKAVFLDRDGTINKYVGFLRNIDEFELIDGVADAIKKINASGYLAIVVTNQPVIARGEVSFEELEEIHNKMETLLGKEGAYLDAIYFCPHHPHKGYEGERPELKFDCDCRKPKPGMLLRAAKDFNIDLSQSWMVGDGENDIKAGQNSGCRTALIGNESYGQAVTVASLNDFAERYLK